MGDIFRFLDADHDRLDAILARVRNERDEIDTAAYEEFRRGLLKHIGMEEMILLPAVKSLLGKPAVLAKRARLDHGAITALLVPTPTPAIVAAVRKILGIHNEMEERSEGLYQQCEDALGAQAGSIFMKLQTARDIPPAAHADGPHVMAVVRRALADAGYSAADL